MKRHARRESSRIDARSLFCIKPDPAWYVVSLHTGDWVARRRHSAVPIRRTSAQRAAWDIVSIVPSIRRLWITLPATMTAASNNERCATLAVPVPIAGGTRP